MLTVTTVTSRATMTHSSEETSGKEMERRGCADLGIWRRPLLQETGASPAHAYSTPAGLNDW
jgi:hypothetical protein